MPLILALLTYFAYCFIVVMYTRKAVKYLSLPIHLRWDLYPVIHETRYRYGGSHLENIDSFDKPRSKAVLRGILYLAKEYLTLGEYFSRQKLYWLALYPWHVGFMLIITFHILAFFGAVLLVAGIAVEAGASAGGVFYYVMLACGVVSFVAGLFGSAGMLVKRLADPNLRDYATRKNYFTYAFCFVVFASGLYGWYFVDPAFSEYREFWKGLITLRPIGVAPGAAAHIILFDLFLIYLPFTRSMHYITRIFAFFFIRWDDRPNVRGGAIEKELQAQFGQQITWSAPHVRKGTWGDQVGDE